MHARILLVEDEIDLATTVEYNLAREGYQIHLAHTGQAGLEAAERAPVPDAVILDLMLPDMTGTEVCRRLRAAEPTRRVPILMCTAKGTELDRVVGFEVGADDYIVKPFAVRELILRVRAILRRELPAPPAPPIVFGRLRLDPEAHRAWIDDAELALTVLELRLLHTFLTRRGRAQTRATLLTDVWGMDSELVTRTVDTHVKRLREKLGEVGDYIETVRGFGYRFRGHAEPD